MIPTWVNDYVGLPFSEYNCWQLVCKVYSDVLNIALPTFSREYYNHKDKKNIANIYQREMKLWSRIKNPKLFDIIVLRIEGQPWHCGMIVEKGNMLHTEMKLESVIERYETRLWKNRIIGFYRYNSGK